MLVSRQGRNGGAAQQCCTEIQFLYNRLSLFTVFLSTCCDEDWEILPSLPFDLALIFSCVILGAAARQCSVREGRRDHTRQQRSLAKQRKLIVP